MLRLKDAQNQILFWIFVYLAADFQVNQIKLRVTCKEDTIDN